MRKIFLFIAFISMYFLGQAQYAPTSAKTRFVNGIGLSTKDTSSLTNAGDTLVIIMGMDSVPYVKYKGYWKALAYRGASGVTSVATNNGTGITGGTITNTGTIAADTSILATRLRVQKGIDSVNANVNLRVKYTDTASMLSPYQRSYNAMKYTDTATMLSSYYNKTATNSLLSSKLNISDTSSMLSGYKTYYPRNAISGGTGISYNSSTGVITNSSPSLGGTVTSVATNYGLLGGTITTSGTLSADSSLLSTKLWRQKGVDSVQANVNLRVKYTDTAAMLSPYLKTSNAITSVGLSMPVAFTVSNTPLTSNGTISVTGAGTSSQYIRGDGQLATYNNGGGGGGSSVNYYLNGGTAASVSTYYQMSNTAVIGTGANFSTATNGIISQFLTDAGNPNSLTIPAGAWTFQLYFSASSAGGTPTYYVELYKYSVGGTFTLIASNSGSPDGITSGTATELYVSNLPVPTTTLLATDRLAVRIYVATSGKTITLYTQDSHLCKIVTTFSSGISALNGLTANTQYFATGTSGTDFAISSLTDTHTFNLPTASATNRGALSSANWTTFNNKIAPSDTATMLFPYLRSTNYGLLKSSQTVSADSSLLSTKLWRQKGIDSVQANINLKVNISDTATMLSGYKTYYPRAALSAGTGITYNASTGVITNSSPSLGGTVTSVATDATLTGGTITTSGTLKVDTSVMATRLRVQKGIDSVSANVNLRVKYTDTASMLSPYARTLALSNYLPLTGGTLSTTSSSPTLQISNGGVGYGLYVQSDTYFQGDVNLQSAPNSLLKTVSKKITNAVAGTDYQAPITLTTTGTSGAATFTSNTLNIPQYQAAGTYVTSVTGTSPIVSSGGTTPAISIPVATTSVSGYLSSTDWNTFNNKQSALTNPVTGTGTTNYLTKFTGTSTIGNSLLYDNGTNVGIGTITPGSKLEINAASSSSILRVAGGGDGTGGGKGNIRSSDQGGTNYWDFGRDNLTTGNFVLTSGGGSPFLSITTTGAATFSSSVQATNIGVGYAPQSNIGAFIYRNASDYALAVQQDGSGIPFQVTSGGVVRLYVANGGNVGIGTTSITSGTKLEVTGNISIKSGTDAYFQTTDGNNVIVRADQQSGTSGKGVYLQYWNTSGWQTGLYILNNGSAGTYSPLVLQQSGGNVLIGTGTDAGYKLDVNGTGRFTGALTGTSAMFSGNLTFTGAGSKSIGWGGNTSSAAAYPLIYSDNSYLAINSKAGSALYFNFDNTNSASTVDFFAGRAIISYAGAATFSSSVTAASGFIKTGYSDSYFLLAGGGTTPTSNYAPATGGSYLPLAGGTLTGALNGTSATFSGNVIGTGIFSNGDNTATAPNQFQVSGVTNTNKQLLIGYNTTGNGYGSIQAVFQGTAYTPLVLNPLGANVGIGTTSPNTIFSVVKAETLNAFTDFAQFSDNTNGLRISNYFDAGGIRWDFRRGTTSVISISQANNVGIGTTSPNRNLVVDGGASNDAYLKLTMSSTLSSLASGILFNNNLNSDGSIYIRLEGNSNQLSYNTSGTHYFGGGNVLIGTTTDAGYKLDVNGTGRFSGNVLISDNSVFGLRANYSTEYAIQYKSLDFRLIGSDDVSTNRNFSFGYYTSNNLSGTWNSKATINSYTGAATFSSSVTATDLIAASLNAGSPYNLTLGTSGADAGSVIMTAGSTSGYNTSIYVGGGTSATNPNSIVFKTASTTRLTIASTGAATFSSSVTATGFFESSDRRLKNIVSRNNDMITFKWKTGDTLLHYGYIAQEVEKTMPDQVKTDEKGMKSVNYIEVLVKKINDLENRIKQLEK